VYCQLRQYRLSITTLMFNKPARCLLRIRLCGNVVHNTRDLVCLSVCCVFSENTCIPPTSSKFRTHSKLKSANCKMTFFGFCPAGANHCTDWGQIWKGVADLRSTRAREQESFCASFFVCLSRWAWLILVSQTCRDVHHFNEVQLRHLLIDFQSS